MRLFYGTEAYYKDVTHTLQRLPRNAQNERIIPPGHANREALWGPLLAVAPRSSPHVSTPHVKIKPCLSGEPCSGRRAVQWQILEWDETTILPVHAKPHPVQLARDLLLAPEDSAFLQLNPESDPLIRVLKKPRHTHGLHSTDQLFRLFAPLGLNQLGIREFGRQLIQSHDATQAEIDKQKPILASQCIQTPVTFIVWDIAVFADFLTSDQQPLSSVHTILFGEDCFSSVSEAVLERLKTHHFRRVLVLGTTHQNRNEDLVSATCWQREEDAPPDRTMVRRVVKAIYGSVSEVKEKVDVTTLVQGLDLPLHFSQPGCSSLTPACIHNHVQCDPCPGAPKALRLWLSDGEFYEVHERGHAWLSYLTITRSTFRASRLRVEIVPEGGLCNQLINLMRTALIAKTLNRSLTLPPCLARQTVQDAVCSRSRAWDVVEAAQAHGYLLPLSHLLDTDLLVSKLADLGISCTDEDHSGTSATFLAVDSFWTPLRSSADIPHALPGAWVERIVVQPLLCRWSVPPTPDASLYVSVLRHLRPAPRLQTRGTQFLSCLRQRAGLRPIVAIHVRLEHDWELQFRVIGVQEIVDALGDSLPSFAVPPLIYTMGQVSDADLQTLKTACPTVEIVAKQSLPEAQVCFEGLGFEESAVIDRETGIAVDCFIGNNRTSFSSLVAVERDALKRDYAMFPRRSFFSSEDQTFSCLLGIPSVGPPQRGLCNPHTLPGEKSFRVSF